MKKLNSVEKLTGIFIGFICCMIACRIVYSGSMRYIFLLWNIFLAWIPFKLSMFLIKKDLSKWKQCMVVFIWLLFFPNALYIVTDLIHLETKTNVPIWYDAVLIFSAATIGLIMAFVSLFNVEVFLSTWVAKKYIPAIIFTCLFLGAFGVYLGRFLRWNSWDIITDPVDLGIEIMQPFLFPHEYWRTWSITILFTGLFSMLYLLSKKIPGYFKPGK